VQGRRTGSAEAGAGGGEPGGREEDEWHCREALAYVLADAADERAAGAWATTLRNDHFSHTHV
jgi:hypothetical protein